MSEEQVDIPGLLHVLIVLLMVVIICTFLGVLTTVVSNGDERITGYVVVAAAVLTPILYIISVASKDKR